MNIAMMIIGSVLSIVFGVGSVMSFWNSDLKPSRYIFVVALLLVFLGACATSIYDKTTPYIQNPLTVVQIVSPDGKATYFVAIDNDGNVFKLEGGCVNEGYAAFNKYRSSRWVNGIYCVNEEPIKIVIEKIQTSSVKE